MTTTDPYDREFVAEFYDRVHPYAGRRDLDFYTGLAVESGGPVLELGCGTGRVMIPAAERGIAITGVDASPHMLAICRDKLAREPSEVRERAQVVECDMRELDLRGEFKLVTIPFRPFQHLITVEEQLACLAGAHRHLEPGGRLAFDVFDPDVARLVAGDDSEGAGEPPFAMPDGRTVVRKHRSAAVDLKEQVISAELIYYVTHPDGTEERLVHAFPFRYFFRYEVEHLLARAGFDVTALYGGFDRSPPGSKRPGELIFVARRA